jgi:uncharacterized cupredoxin-like copper-binding protein
MTRAGKEVSLVKKLLFLPVLIGGVVATLLLTTGASATDHAKSAAASHRAAARHATATVITVVAGKPGEFAFELSKSSKLHAGTFTFKVTDKGQGFHTFKVCAKPVKTAAANACTGKVTKTVHPGQTVTLTVTITKNGKYEVLCSLPGHAAAGMKGLIGVGVAVKPFKVPPPNTGTTSTTSTTVTGPLEPNGCPAGTPPGTTIGSDEDGDESGGNPDDGDGCL